MDEDIYFKIHFGRHVVGEMHSDGLNISKLYMVLAYTASMKWMSRSNLENSGEEFAASVPCSRTANFHLKT